MTADPRSLAGIEGLLLECSPCVLLEHEATPDHMVGAAGIVVTAVSPDVARSGEGAVVVSVGSRPDEPLPVSAVELDLMHRTGRCHAAWFVQDRYTDLPQGTLRLGDTNIVNCARCGSDLPPGGMERLRDLVLLAAGRGDAVASAPTSER